MASVRLQHMGNLEFNASDDDICHVLNEEFFKVPVEDVTIPWINGKSTGYGFVKISWAYNAPITMKDTCIYRTGNVFVNSRPIYFSELNDKAETSSTKAATRALKISATWTATTGGMLPMRMVTLSDGGVYVCDKYIETRYMLNWGPAVLLKTQVVWDRGAQDHQPSKIHPLCRTQGQDRTHLPQKITFTGYTVTLRYC